jgi:long-chain acyl-CoA synthetase
MELLCELTVINDGIAIGYSSPVTLLDNSTGIKEGQIGDIRLLKPSLMAAVPIILERLSKAVHEKMYNSSWFLQLFFGLAYTQKLRKFKIHANTRLLDAMMFNKIRNAVLGERLRMMLTGGSILSREVHEFTQVCFAPTYQAYGLTETCACATSNYFNQTIPAVAGR